MTRAEALVLMIWCVPLASKLANRGIGTELTREDRITLDGFSRVWEAGWLKNPVIYQLTGLSRSDIEHLTAKMQMEQESQSEVPTLEITAAAPPAETAAGKVTPVEIGGLAEAKQLFLAERFDEVLEKLYPLAADYPENLEIQGLINQSLRALRAPSKLIITTEPVPEKPVGFSQRLAVLFKGKGRAKVEKNTPPRTLFSTLRP